MWKLDDKYKECCHNESCDSFDTCIECWDEWAERNPPMTNADRIRAMSDEELAQWMLNGISTDPCDYCEYNNEYCDGSPCRGKADADKLIEWLQQPAEEGEHV